MRNSLIQSKNETTKCLADFLVISSYRPKIGTDWYWLPASGRGMVLIRRQMLPHFPTVTQSAGFQPEPLITTPCSLLITHCSSLTTHRSLPIACGVLASSQQLGRRSLSVGKCCRISPRLLKVLASSQNLGSREYER